LTTCVILAPALVAFALGSCGGAAATPASSSGAVDVDADPIALLPADAVILGNLDAKGFFASESAASQVARFVTDLVPIGDECGFEPARDVDRVVVAIYSTQGADAAVVIHGRFDAAKIASAAAVHSATRAGGMISTATYLGQTVYVVDQARFVVLTPKTVVSGTDAGVRRVLERIQAGKVGRAVAPWMIATVETQGAKLAFAADFHTQPLTAVAIQSMPIAFLSGMTMARVVSAFGGSGAEFAATLTYGDASGAAAAADQIRSVSGWGQALSAWLTFIPRVDHLDVQTQSTDVKLKGQIDDRALRGLLAMTPGLVHARATP
jgi:hypothetical protein